MGLSRYRETVERRWDEDTLVLWAWPTQRNLEAVQDVERKEALAGVEMMRTLGIDPMAEAAKASTAELQAAAEAVQETEASLAVRRVMLECLGVSLRIDGELLEGPGLIEAYENLNPASVRWVDEQVAEVWKAAMLTDAEGESPGGSCS